MELEAAKVIGAGLAVIGVIGSGIGIGNIFSSFIPKILEDRVDTTIPKSALFLKIPSPC